MIVTEKARREPSPDALRYDVKHNWRSLKEKAHLSAQAKWHAHSKDIYQHYFNDVLLESDDKRTICPFS